MRPTLDDSVEGLVTVCVVEELRFFFPSIVFEESGVSDGIDIDVLGWLGSGFLIERAVARDINSVGEVKIFGLI